MEFVDEFSSQKEVVFEFDDGIREMVDEERAIALLETLSLPSPPNRVNLSNKSYSDTAAVRIAKKLNEFKGSIKVADIHDMIAGRPEDEALRSFSTIADSLKGNALEELNISDNALGAKGIQACRDLMVLGSLKRVFILNNGISEAAAELTATVLLDEGVRPELTLFNFYNNMCGNGGAAAVARIVDANPTLTDVR
jgi:Ran GTPase-activating protein 1